ncbi:MAG: type II 3-dehydroquinate dehydratase [Lachnospiraceae bacterium]
MKFLVINGVNLNFLGIREREVYGDQDYDYLVRIIKEKAEADGDLVECFQSNHEGAIVDRIQQAYFDGTDGLIINPGAHTHYSYAIHDALKSVTMPKVEVHISRIDERESFRHTSVTLPACDAQIVGEGFAGYLKAMDLAKELRRQRM